MSSLLRMFCTGAAVCLFGCAPVNSGPDLNAAAMKQPQIDALRSSLARLRFPQTPDAMKRFIPAAASGGSTSIADVFPNAKGLLAIYVYRYPLNPNYFLEVREGHYRKKGKTVRIVEKAEVVRGHASLLDDR